MKAKNQAARGSADRAEVWRRAETHCYVKINILYNNMSKCYTMNHKKGGRMPYYGRKTET